MTADAEQVAERANDALDQIATLSEALACCDCSRIFRTGSACPYCASQSLLNVARALGAEKVAGRVRVVIAAILGDLWATPEQLEALSDEEIIELCHEDISSLVEEAEWRVERRRPQTTNEATEEE